MFQLNDWLRRSPAARVALLLALGSALAIPALAEDTGRGFGLGRFIGVSGAYGFGSRYGESGNAYLLRAEGAGYFMTTTSGNRGGMEGGMELGYDGYPTRELNAMLGRFWCDFWLGFPVTLVELGGEDQPWFTTALAPGLGLNNNHSYVYIKGKIAAAVAPAIALELNYQWTPYSGSASNLEGTKIVDGIAIGTLRGLIHFAVSKDISLFGYFDWRQSNIEQPTPSADPELAAFAQKPYNSTAFAPLLRTRYDDNYRVGFGVAF